MHDRILALEARGELSYEAQIAMWPQIELAIKDGEAERDEVRRALRALADASVVLQTERARMATPGKNQKTSQKIRSASMTVQILNMVLSISLPPIGNF